MKELLTLLLFLCVHHLSYAISDTLFVKLDADTISHKVDTLFTSSTPDYIVFESAEHTTLTVTLACGIRPIQSFSSSKNKLNYPTQQVNWEIDRFYIGINHPTDTIVRELYIFSDSILEVMTQKRIVKRKKEEQRIKDSLNYIQTTQMEIKAYEDRFQNLKQQVQTLSEKDKQQITKLHKKFCPPGVLKVNDTLFYDETEVANIHWLEYLYLLHKDSSNTVFTRAKPDTTVWLGYGYADEYIDHYLRYPGFRYFPVVGISYEQAYAYCIWRANMINNDLQKEYQDTGYEIIVHYRLPTPKEFDAVTKNEAIDKDARFSYPYLEYSKKKIKQLYNQVKDSAVTYSLSYKHLKKGIEFFLDSDSAYIIDAQVADKETTLLDSLMVKNENLKPITTWIFSHRANSKGLYNIYGNVAEMTTLKGIAKGGSFHHNLEECLYDQVQIYDSPQAWLGFRCVAEVIIRKKEVQE